MSRRKRKAISAKYVPYIFIVFGLLWFVFAGVFAKDSIHLTRNGARTEGVVTDLVLSDRGGYAPIFQFQPLNGERTTIRSSVSSNPPRFSVGEEVLILYDQESPENAIIQSWATLWLGSTITGFSGLIFGGIGLAALLSVRRQRQLSPEKAVLLRKRINPRYVPYVFLGFGIFWFLIAGFIGTVQMGFTQRAVVTEGRVVRMAQTGDNRVSPIVQFRLPNEETVEFRSSISSSNPRYSVEDPVQVRYDPENPYSAQIVGAAGAWIAVVIMALFGTIFSVIGIFLVFRSN